MTRQEPSRQFVRRIHQAGLRDVYEKLCDNIRLSHDDGVRLGRCPDLVALGLLANERREKLHGDLCYFNRNLHINATNVCEASCIFCSFARLETGDPAAWTLSIEQAVDRVRALDTALVSEVHIVNGLNPDLPFSYYTDLLEALKTARPELHIKGFTAVEIAYYAEKYDMEISAVLDSLRAAGLDSLPGGGAEIFAPRTRRKLCHDKVDGAGWLKIHEIAHTMGMRTNATMLFGSIETLEERIDHLCQLRALQDHSLREGATNPNHAGGRFQTFIPLRFHNDNNRLRRLASPTGFDSLRIIAISRLMLDNFPHIKAYWPMLGTQIAQVAQHFGASDLDGTVREEHIYHMAGADTPQGLTPESLSILIEKADRQPVERDTLYHVIRRLDESSDTQTSKSDSIPSAKVGIVDYKNAIPLTRYLDQPNLSRSYGHPSEVASWLHDGEVDIALVPVAALLNDPIQGPANTELRVIPDLAIGCDGAVHSVLVVAETPLEEWTHLYLDGVSRTSVRLAELLFTRGPLAARVRSDIRIEDVPAHTGLDRATGTRATLVIGDRALDIADRFTHTVDLGRAWKDWTGLPFVFAVWAGRSDLDPRIVEQIRGAGLNGLKDLRAGRLESEMSSSDHTYLRQHIRYDLDDSATMGLMRFGSLGYRTGLLSSEHFSLYPPIATEPMNTRELGVLIRDLLQGEGEVEDLLSLAKEAPLLELLATAGLENLMDRHVSYEATGDESEQSVSSMPFEELGGLRIGARQISGRFATTGEWLETLKTKELIDLRLSPGPETTFEHWARLLMSLRQSRRPFVRSLTLRDPGSDGTPFTTGVEWLRCIALTRIALPEIPHIVVDTDTHGPGLGQLALYAGATDLGSEKQFSEHRGIAMERHIRRAGFEPARRSSEWEPIPGLVSPPEDMSRPIRRLDSPN